VVAKKHLSLAQSLTFESHLPSPVKLASYEFLVCVVIFLKLLRTVKQTLHLVPSSLIFLGLINGVGLVAFITWVSAMRALKMMITGINTRFLSPLCGAALEMNKS